VAAAAAGKLAERPLETGLVVLAAMVFNLL
jgi:hypothetical protein